MSRIIVFPLPKKALSYFSLKIHLNFHSFFPPLLLILITTVIGYLNFTPHTYLTGWDNLHPEFFPRTNLLRTVFATWQEYQSLGLLGGMAHAADLPHQLLIYALSFTPLNPSLFRYLVTFVLLSAGSLGTYLFLKIFLHSFDRLTKTIAAFLGGLFYLLNLATIQTFYTPFESFTYFYAFFPWLILSSISYLKKPSKSTFFKLSLVSLLASPSFYVETLFVVYALCLLPLIITHFHPKRVMFYILNSIFCNSYWLFPVIFFVLTNGSIGVQSHINQIATPETYYRNLEFGNLNSLALLKGFWFNFTDLGPNQKFDYLMSTWRNHLANPSITVIGYTNFFLVITGIIYAVKKKLAITGALLDIVLICLFFLAGGGLLINNHLPLIGELFRSPFTKFSTPLSFTFAVFFSIGTIFLLDLFSFLHSRLTYLLTTFTVSLGLVIFTAPVFTGNLFSSNLRLSIPKEYFQVFDYFQTQDPSTRIANFPQYTFWGWNYYSWGYRGSGFLWYGLHQPILDRAFDVWSHESEKYYDEINQAVYSQNPDRFDSLIDKYSVNWLLIDKYVISPENDKATSSPGLLSIIEKNPKYTLERNFSNKILVYSVKQDSPSNKFISLGHDTPTSSLFDLSLRPDTLWQVSPTNLRLPIDTKASPKSVTLPSYSQTENLVPVKISYRKNFDLLEFEITPLLPALSSGNKTLSPHVNSTITTVKLLSKDLGFILDVNRQYYEFQLPAELAYQKDFYPLTTTYLPTNSLFSFNLYSNNQTNSTNLTPFLLNSLPYQCYTEKPDRKIEKILEGNSVTLLGTDVVGCLSTPLPPTPDLISVVLEYSSSTNTPARANITDSNLGGYPSTVAPLPSSPQPKQLHLYSQCPDAECSNAKLNLLLEANETKSTQEITYKKITMYSHPLQSSQTLKLPPIKSATFDLPSHNSTLFLDLPVIDSPLSTHFTPLNNTLFPSAKNCNNFAIGRFDKIISPDNITYSSTNAITCDFANLPHLPHDIAYLLSVTNTNTKGMSPIACFENHTTRRCDIYERLSGTPLTQSIIAPVTNPLETPGYTFHLYNTSFGNYPSINSVKDITINPIPLNFLQNITYNQDKSKMYNVKSSISSVSHPAEFLYFITADSDIPTTLNLFQAYSPYWFMTPLPANLQNLPLYKFIPLYTRYMILDTKFSTLTKSTQTDWHNSWTINSGNQSYMIIYLPQYLQFLGFALLPLPMLLFVFHRNSKNIKS